MDFTALKQPLSPPLQAGGIDVSLDPQWLATTIEWKLFTSNDPPAADLKWRSLQATCLKELERTRDLRVLAHLAAASIRLDGWMGYAEVVATADAWLEDLWDDVYPRGSDATFGERSSALSLFAHPLAILSALRRLPLVRNGPEGGATLRDYAAATAANDNARSEAMRSLIQADPAALGSLRGCTAKLQRSLNAMDNRMRVAGGAYAQPDFADLLDLLEQLSHLLGIQAAASVVAGATVPPEVGSTDAGLGTPSDPTIHARSPRNGFQVASRVEADQALEAVATYMSVAEPTNPVAILIASARRLLSRTDFLSMIEDLAPEIAVEMRKRLLMGPGKSDVTSTR